MDERSKTASDAPSTHISTLAVDLRIVLGKLTRRLREQGQRGDLTWSQVAVISRLKREGPATVTSLARAENMRPQSMGAIVAALESAELVSGAPDPADGRQTILSLTPLCHEWIASSRAAREDWLLQSIQTNLSPEEQEELTRLVELLERLANS